MNSSMRELTHLSLFSGIGGLDLAAGWAGFRTVGQCEWADYPSRVLERHWPDVPRWKDIRTLTKESFYERTGLRTVDVVSGGFPCQPFSVAGKRGGSRDDRYLWPEMARVVAELRPAWVIGENVAGIVSMALDDVLFDLEGKGYATRTFLIPAAGVGALHQRYRTAIVGYAEHNGPSSAAVCGINEKDGGREQEGEKETFEPEGTGGHGNGKDVAYAEGKHKGGLPIGKGAEKPGSSCSGTDVQHTDSAGRKESHTPGKPEGEGFPDRAENPVGGQEKEPEPERPGSSVPDTGSRKDVRGKRKQQAAEKTGRGGKNNGGGKEEHVQRERRPAEPGMGGVADGLPSWVDGYWDVEPDIPRVTEGAAHRADRLKGLGNAAVPQQFYPVFRAVAEIIRMAERKGKGE